MQLLFHNAMVVEHEEGTRGSTPFTSFVDWKKYVRDFEPRHYNSKEFKSPADKGIVQMILLLQSPIGRRKCAYLNLNRHDVPKLLSGSSLVSPVMLLAELIALTTYDHEGFILVRYILRVSNMPIHHPDVFSSFNSIPLQFAFHYLRLKPSQSAADLTRRYSSSRL